VRDAIRQRELRELVAADEPVGEKVSERAGRDGTHRAISRHDSCERELPAVERDELAIAATGQPEVRNISEVIDIDGNTHDAREHRSFDVN
jgi:hypothetical protein